MIDDGCDKQMCELEPLLVQDRFWSEKNAVTMML
jgi:hypothetical protein